MAKKPKRTPESIISHKEAKKAAADLGRRGGFAAKGKGVKAYLSSLTPEERIAKAKKASDARWDEYRKAKAAKEKSNERHPS